MAYDYARPNAPALVRIVAETTKNEAYGSYENMKNQLRAALKMPNPATEGLEMPPTPAATAALASPVATTGSHIRVVYPSGNMRVELYGDSAESLDLQEARIRALYQ
jgi:hypothetical protein